MPKNFRDEIDSACDHALASFGFQSRRRGRPLIQISEDFYGWVGLSTSGAGDTARVDPFIGVHSVAVMRLFYELDFHRKPRPKYRIGQTVTVGVPMGALALDMKAFFFQRSEPLEGEANRLAEAVAEYGLPWMRAHASLDALLAPLRENEAMLGGFPERVAIVLYLFGRFEEVTDYLDRKRDEFAQHPNWGLTHESWKHFSDALRDRIANDDRSF